MSAFDQMALTWDVVVIGAGPAGLAAATLTANAGLSTLVLDENAGVGGQIWRAITTTPVLSRPVLGADYWKGREVALACVASGAVHMAGATVWSLSSAREIAVSCGGRSRLLTARRVILATGAMERPFPIPGWTLPGVMTIGGAQTVLKASGLVPTGRVVLAGSGPLLWLYADQLLRAGGAIQAILDTTDRTARAAALRHGWAFARSPYLAKGLTLMARVHRKVRVIDGVTALAVEGPGKVDQVIYRRGSAHGERMLVDTLLLHQGVVPNANLAMAAGIAHRWDEQQLCFVPCLSDADGSTSRDGIAIAGDSAGIAGAEAAVERGRIAGQAAARALGVDPSRLPDISSARRHLHRYERARAFLDAFYRPASTFRIPQGDTIVCRCEEVTAQNIVDAVAIGCHGPNQVKSFLRCGMGPCQGRMCSLTVTEVIAQARGLTPAEIGTFRLRPPVKPITVAELAAISALQDNATAANRN